MDRERIGVKPGINILPSPVADRVKILKPAGSEEWFLERFEQYKAIRFRTIQHRVDYLYYTQKKHSEYLREQGFEG